MAEDRFEKGNELTDDFNIIGETTDGMPVAKRPGGEFFYLTDGKYILSDGYHRIDAIGRYRYVCWVDTHAKEIALDNRRVNFDRIDEVKRKHKKQ